MREMSVAAARRAALASQGFGSGPSGSTPTRRTVQRVVDRIRVFQIDSVSVAVRAHYMPMFSRVGAYDRSLLDDAAWTDSRRRPRLLVEYWAHEAAFMPVSDWPLMRWRMHRYRNGRWRGGDEALTRNPRLVQDVLDVVAGNGASSAGDIESLLGTPRPGRKGPWWDYSDTKTVCEQLFSAGALAVSRRDGFIRRYDLAERVVPDEVRGVELDEPDAVRRLVANSVRALGVATEPDIRDYHRLSPVQSRTALRELVEEGTVDEVGVRGWEPTAYAPAGLVVPRRASTAALLCPFDPLIFFRDRTERLFGFRYRLEIYTPAHKRIHGYYVFPFLLDDALVARVDLKSDRPNATLMVRSAFAEPGRDTPRVASALAEQLRAMARWLGLERVQVESRGDLAPRLADEFRRATVDAR
ncbi:winged helix-turn-helix domain-containing protein [Rhodococcus triatomae]|uniref:Winged helix-turn-helix domain-containing protein n=1 Tax=Rhodococcus triatomae TaxID=300028 RepID=A0A1G8N077_9NOCA|nr:crosslink repair DNA glycosylase YcaQ family protein [Rhodococcus triatomae]QNG19140.1 winged helix-turn-helix domain-containing protein [Rhodococcus triatomae]QNG24948.1 winged helix-turn-helix domain-containing protein [Rhodococcus triatomae]SDI73526.1 hypothetical protein SAMN05444695_110136 [Rhodococcus triatomae]